MTHNEEQELSLAAMFLSDQDERRKLYEGPSIDVSHQILKGIFMYHPIRDKNCQLRPYKLSDRDEIKNLLV